MGDAVSCYDSGWFDSWLNKLELGLKRVFHWGKGERR